MNFGANITVPPGTRFALLCYGSAGTAQTIYTRTCERGCLCIAEQQHKKRKVATYNYLEEKLVLFFRQRFPKPFVPETERANGFVSVQADPGLPFPRTRVPIILTRPASDLVATFFCSHY